MLEVVFVYKRRRFVKTKVKAFHYFARGKCVSYYTLHSCGGTLHKRERSLPKSLSGPFVCFQVSRPTFMGEKKVKNSHQVPAEKVRRQFVVGEM